MPAKPAPNTASASTSAAPGLQSQSSSSSSAALPSGGGLAYHCKDCKAYKPLADMRADYPRQCKACRRAYKQAYYEKHQQTIKTKNLQHYHNTKEDKVLKAELMQEFSIDDLRTLHSMLCAAKQASV